MGITYKTCILHYVVYYLLCSSTNTSSFRLYNTRYSSLSNSNDNNCIYQYGSTENGKGRYLVSYCIRVDDKDQPKQLKECYGTSYTFGLLGEKNISSNELFS